MSDDEAVVTVVCMAITLATWTRWYWILSTGSPHPGPRPLWLLRFVPIACLAATLIVLGQWSSHDVRSSMTYMAMYGVMGMAWVGAMSSFMSVLGLSVRDDVVERRNSAASYAIAGSMLGMTFCFAGANIGDGPGWWVVVFSAALATATLLLSWWVVDRFARIGDILTIERSASVGLSFMGFQAAIGLILGRAVAGTWVSAPQTVADFAGIAWVVPIFVLVEIVLLKLRSSGATDPRKRFSFAGAFCGLLTFLVALVYVAILGPWT